MSHPIVETILAGEAPAQVKGAAARGALPIPREDLIELWVLLRSDPDPEIRMACRENLAEVAESEWSELLPSHPFDPRVYDFAIRILGKNEALLQATLRSKRVPAETLAWLAGSASGGTLDALLDNQVMLIETPSVVVSMLNNPQINPTQVRKIFDLAEQFYRGHAEIPALLEQRHGLKLGHAGGDFAPSLAEVMSPEELPEPLPSEAEPFEGTYDEAVLLAANIDIPIEMLGDQSMTQEEFKSLYQRILKMSVPAKVSLALKGNKEGRMLLIRDSNKVVQMAVVHSPKITEGEVESIAKMRSLPDELMRLIARNREWLKKYPILKALATNPKLPPGVAIGLVPNLQDFDLKMLLKDKNVSEVVRREAKRIWEVRNTRKVVNYSKKH